MALKTGLALLSLLLVGQFSMAQTDDESLAALDAKYSESERTVKDLETKLRDLKKAQSQLREDALKSGKWEFAGWEDTGSSRGGPSSRPKYKLSAVAQDVQDKQEALRLEVENHTQQLNLAQGQLSEVSTKIKTKNAEQKTAEAKIAAFEKSLRAANLKTNFMSLSDRLDNIDDSLNMLEQSLDNAVLGVYMKDKMAQMLNSNALCKAQVRCNGDASKVIDSKDMTEIFGSTEESTRKTFPKAGAK